MEDEGEEDEGPAFVDDSQSEGSAPSELVEEEVEGGAEGDEEDGGAEGSVGDAAAGASTSTTRSKKARRSKKKGGKKEVDEAMTTQPPAQSSFKAMADTEAMMNGLKISDGAQEEAVDFSSMGEHSNMAASAGVPTNGHVANAAERQRLEHEEYRKKRDSDPAFIPNRGNFFMHDTRGQPNGQVPPPRGAWAARGRGRGMPGAGGPFPPMNPMAPAERPAEQQWKHDLHNTVNEDARPQASLPARPVDPTQDQIDSARLFPKAPSQAQVPHTAISFSSTKLVGKVQIRVVLPDMKAPITFSAVPWKQYIRLPDHRPPLRRDKPVRVSIPGHTQRYIFPSSERSFIFIPRQMRPNQQRFGHSAYQRSIGGYGYSSRRTSMYGGSMYSASVAASRRSSLAGVNRERAFSPAGSFAAMPQHRPVVRLPHSAQHSSFSTPVGPLSGVHTPTMPQMYNVPPPQAPVYQGTPTTTVHQPRPQKTISVTGIESPAVLEQAASEPQPFQNQLPAHMHEAPPPPPYFSPRQQYPYTHSQPSQQQTGTPLSGIPEQAIHAPAFQPPMYGGQQNFYPPPYVPPQQQPNYYYSPPNHNGYPPMPPMYQMPPQGYMGPPMSAPYQPQQQQPPPHPPSQPHEDHQHQQQHSHHQPQPSQSGMVAHESNGMVFYTRQSDTQGQGENYQPAESFVPSYAMPGLPPPTPAPENSMSYYYPQHMGDGGMGMQEVGTGVYYPAGPGQQQ